jgi:PadR family transcriptional regulator PadR
VARSRIPSPQTIAVLTALAADPAGWRHGYDVGLQTGLKAGSLYPILIRLADRGLLEARWEANPPPGRPARHLYRLTPAGLELAGAHAPTVPIARRRAPRAAAPRLSTEGR